jgi:hypothetical protein
MRHLIVCAVVIVSSLLLRCACVAEAQDRTDQKIDIAGDAPVAGFYDPSVEYSQDGRTGWLAYSSVTGNEKPFGPYVHTHLAKSLDHGASWKFVQTVNMSVDDSLKTPAGTYLSGVWRYEVPSLVNTPNDPGRGWKLFAHKYFSTRKEDRMFAYGWIVYRWASDPAGTWSEEIPLFGAGRFPPVPYHATKVDLNTLDPGLRDVVAYSEPGAFFKDSRLYLSLTAARPDGPGQLILIASGDRGQSWSFIRTLANRADAQALGYEYLDGSSIVEEDGRVFLLAVPGSSRRMHDGTWIIEFEDLTEGKLRRDSKGKLVVYKRIPPQQSILSGPGAGQSGYHRFNTGGGIIFPQFNLRAYPEVFQIFNTHQRIVLPPKP